MIVVFDYQIGMLAFFVFSFLAGVYIFATAIWGCKGETRNFRIMRGALGLVYAVITVIAFQYLETISSRYMNQLLPLVALLKKP